MRPVKSWIVGGDGNCLFRSVSYALHVTEATDSLLMSSPSSYAQSWYQWQSRSWRDPICSLWKPGQRLTAPITVTPCWQQMLLVIRCMSGDCFVFQQDSAPAHRACDIILNLLSYLKVAKITFSGMHSYCKCRVLYTHENHSYTKKRYRDKRKIRKLGCPAVVIIQNCPFFTDFKVCYECKLFTYIL